MQLIIASSTQRLFWISVRGGKKEEDEKNTLLLTHERSLTDTHTKPDTVFFHTHRAGCYINSRKESEHVQNKN